MVLEAFEPIIRKVSTSNEPYDPPTELKSKDPYFITKGEWSSENGAQITFDGNKSIQGTDVIVTVPAGVAYFITSISLSGYNTATITGLSCSIYSFDPNSRILLRLSLGSSNIERPFTSKNTSISFPMPIRIRENGSLRFNVGGGTDNNYALFYSIQGWQEPIKR